MFWLNQRPIKDQTLQAALNQAYRAFLEKDQFPEAYIFLDVPASEVDVNIHPTKTEVRFINSKRLFSFLYGTLEQSLLKEMGIKEVPFSKQKPKESWSRPTQEDRPIYPPSRESKHPFAQELFIPWGQEVKRGPQVLGQYLNFYIIAADEKGILIIDQHNAHERVLFDKYKDIDSKEKLPRALSVSPHIIELSPSQESLFKENRDIIKKAGFGVDSMGGSSYAVKEYPDIFKEDEAEELFYSLLEAVAEGEEAGREIRSKKDKIIATMACKSAIKAGKPLSMDEMSYLVENLFKTSNPSLCPHGRPITIRISKSEIEKGLGRKKG
jgi:DNA mismatch repair protein MutL